MLLKAIILLVTLGTQVWYSFSEPIGFFDLDIGNSTPKLNFYRKNETVSEQRVLFYDGDVEEEVPDKVTICMSFFSSLDRGDIVESSGKNYSRREFPIWSIVDDNGMPNVTFYMRIASSYDDRMEQKEFIWGFVVSGIEGDYRRIASRK